ncbi:MAG: IS1182 family transposase [Hyphomicrobiales bacterium]|nr:IS1182 family transposase [Hyphomicrobiales bacterium]
MGHVEGESRYQRQLVAPSLDETIAADHPVRVVDAFVDTLDLRDLGFAKVAAAAEGRPPYRPGDLLKLYVYGYLNQMRSSRRLEREAARNLEARWLINAVTPSFKTIADFRRDHAAAIVGVCRSFVRFCRGQSLYGGELVAIDGTKVEAAASRKRVITPKRLAEQTAKLDEKIAAYLSAMDAADREEAAGEAQPADVAAALAALRRQRAATQARAKALAEAGLNHEVEGEPEARLMKTARHGHQVAYNAQSAVDAKHGLIVAFDLTAECNDQRQLLPMALAAKTTLAAETLTVAADCGYANGEHGAACQEAGIVAVVPRPATPNPSDGAAFRRDAFAYDAASDSWTCPAGETLSLRKVSQSEQKKVYSAAACGGCALKPRCTNAANRSVTRGFHEDAKEAMHQRALRDPGFMKRRRELVEHPFGVIKWMLGHPRFLLRGLQKAKAELALAVLGFNLKRSIAVRGVPALLDSLQASLG